MAGRMRAGGREPGAALKEPEPAGSGEGKDTARAWKGATAGAQRWHQLWSHHPPLSSVQEPSQAQARGPPPGMGFTNIALPPELHEIYTGSLVQVRARTDKRPCRRQSLRHPGAVQDAFPLVSMVVCGPLMWQYYAGRRYLDLVRPTRLESLLAGREWAEACVCSQGVFAFGFCLAALYHWCQMEPAGLQASRALGVSGPAWRTLDITFAQWLLAHTFGHLVGATHPATVGGRPRSCSLDLPGRWGRAQWVGPAGTRAGRASRQAAAQLGRKQPELPAVQACPTPSTRPAFWAASRSHRSPRWGAWACGS